MLALCKKEFTWPSVFTVCFRVCSKCVFRFAGTILATLSLWIFWPHTEGTGLAHCVCGDVRFQVCEFLRKRRSPL